MMNNEFIANMADLGKKLSDTIVATNFWPNGILQDIEAKYLANDIYGISNIYKSGIKYSIKNVIFNDPATIVFWADGTKTVVKCGNGDTYDPEKGLAMAIAKYHYGNRGCFNDIFRKWLPKDK